MAKNKKGKGANPGKGGIAVGPKAMRRPTWREAWGELSRSGTFLFLTGFGIGIVFTATVVGLWTLLGAVLIVYSVFMVTGLAAYQGHYVCSCGTFYKAEITRVSCPSCREIVSTEPHPRRTN